MFTPPKNIIRLGSSVRHSLIQANIPPCAPVGAAAVITPCGGNPNVHTYDDLHTAGPRPFLRP